MRHILLYSFLLLAGRATSFAQTPDTATLSFYNHPIVTFRAPLGAHSASDRISAASARLNAALEARRPGITAHRAPEGVVLSVGGQPLFTITPSDVDTLAGEQMDSVVARTEQRLKVALAAAAEQRSLGAILRGVLISIIVTILFVVLLRLIHIGRRALKHWLDRSSIGKLHELSVGGVRLFDTDRVRSFAYRLADLLIWAAGFFVAYVWLAVVLKQFPYSRPWGDALGQYLLVTLGALLARLLRGVPGLFTVTVIIVMARFFARLLGTVFDAVQHETIQLRWLHPDTVPPTRRIVTALIWLFAIVEAYPYLPGSDTNVFKGVSLFAGLIVTLGSSGVVGQAMSGLVLMYSRSLKAGEYVQVGNTEGTVVDLGLLATKIQTPKGELVTMPNAVVASASTKNFSRYQEHGRLVLYTSVTIGYDAPWRQVHALLRQAATRTSGVQLSPAPFVMQTALSDYYAEYQLNVYVDKPERRMSILAALHENIQDCFNEYGVQIMSPHFIAQPAAPVVVPRDRWYAPPAGGEASRAGEGNVP